MSAARLHTEETAITERIRAILSESRLSIAQLSALTGVPRSTLARQLRSGDLWLSTAIAICRALDVPPAVVFGPSDPHAVTESSRIATLLDALSPAERLALRAVIESAVELRTAAVHADRLHAAPTTTPDEQPYGRRRDDRRE